MAFLAKKKKKEKISAICFPLCVTSLQPIVTASTQWSKETPMVRLQRRQGDTELISSLQKTPLFAANS